MPVTVSVIRWRKSPAGAGNGPLIRLVDRIASDGEAVVEPVEPLPMREQPTAETQVPQKVRNDSLNNCEAGSA